MEQVQVRPGADALEALIAQGDLSKLSAQQRVDYYLRVCQSLGLNPATQPFQYITLNNKLTLYATKGCTDQLRDSRKIGLTIVDRQFTNELYVVTAHAVTPDGRTDESIGAVAIGGLKGADLANALMKAETKSKRRVTLSISGLGFTDESEIETIPNARPVVVDSTTGEIQPQIAAPKQADSPTTEQAKSAPLPPITGNTWGADQGVLKAFWPWVKAQGLTNVECHAALGVDHLIDFQGTEADARKAITDFIASKAGGK
jgi:hypothetical protein